MRPERLSPSQWLDRQPLQARERLFLILGDASDAQPYNVFLQTIPKRLPQPVWSTTPYAQWSEVMPYVIDIQSDNRFLDWIGQTDSDDWGWLAVSTCAPEVVMEHLRGLTQVRMPDNRAVFFRFWDGRHLLPILNFMGADFSAVLPVFERFLINGRAVDVGQPAAIAQALPYPWWQVPQPLLDNLSGKDLSTQIDNLMQWLEEHHCELVSGNQKTIRPKLERFLRIAPAPRHTLESRLITYLQQDTAS